VEVDVATNAVTAVPYGMVTEMVLAVSLIVPVMPSSENAVIALAELVGALTLLLLPPPQPATKATSSKAANHCSGLVILPNLFI
jgi:hypothetical protein